jgi:hypothetical protein
MLVCLANGKPENITWSRCYENYGQDLELEINCKIK